MNTATENNAKPLLVSVKRAIREIDCSRPTFYRLVSEKKIISFKEGKSRKVVFASIEAYVAQKIAEAQEQKAA